MQLVQNAGEDEIQIAPLNSLADGCLINIAIALRRLDAVHGQLDLGQVQIAHPFLRGHRGFAADVRVCRPRGNRAAQAPGGQHEFDRLHTERGAAAGLHILNHRAAIKARFAEPGQVDAVFLHPILHNTVGARGVAGAQFVEGIAMQNGIGLAANPVFRFINGYLMTGIFDESRSRKACWPGADDGNLPWIVLAGHVCGILPNRNACYRSCLGAGNTLFSSMFG